VADRLERGDVHLAVALPDERFQQRALFPLYVLAVLSDNHRLSRHRTIDIAGLAEQPAACSGARIRPRVLLESAAPHSHRARSCRLRDCSDRLYLAHTARRACHTSGAAWRSHRRLGDDFLGSNAVSCAIRQAVRRRTTGSLSANAHKSRISTQGTTVAEGRSLNNLPDRAVRDHYRNRRCRLHMLTAIFGTHALMPYSPMAGIE
jgi:hypothetical protein